MRIFSDKKNIIIIFVFLVSISAPLIDMTFKLDPFERLSENRPFAKLPAIGHSLLELSTFPQEYTKYFRDNFGFRNTLVRANFFIRFTLLGVSPSREVIVGNNGWLFNAGGEEVEDYRGITHYTDAALRKLAYSLEMKRIWLSSQGIRYLFVIAPNKSTIYGEWMPARYNRVREKNGMDDVVEYLKKNSSVEVIDLRTSLLAAKAKERLYHRTDTHWNDYGAFIAYQEIMKPLVRWFPELNVKSFDDFLVIRLKAAGGDLAGMLGGTEYIKEEFIKFEPVAPLYVNFTGIDDMGVDSVTLQHEVPSSIRALVFRDSFFTAVIPFMTRHFNYAQYYWKPLDSLPAINETIHAIQPNIVIEEITERALKYKY